MVKSNGFSFYNILRGIATKSKPNNSKDIFGSLSESGSKALAIHSLERYLPNELGSYDSEEFDLAPRKNAYFYKYEISKYARQGSVGLKKALELFQAMKRDRLTPTCNNFSPLIYGCAKAGFTKKAFELYDESKKYIRKPSQAIVTCLINACAESPFPEYGLKRLGWFLDHLKMDKNYNLNRVQYHAAIKAYGKLGQLEEAAKMVQEMIDNNLPPETDTLNMLLIGCASKPESGCSLALRIYKRLKYYGLRPNTITYRLMLRCIRDCEIGSPQLIQKTLEELPALTPFERKLRYKKLQKNIITRRGSIVDGFEWFPMISELGSSLSSAVQTLPTTNALENRIAKKSEEIKINTRLVNASDKEATIIPILDNTTPNLLSDDHLELYHKIESIQLDKLRSPINRLLLFGGLTGFLKKMVQDCCKPDSKTFSLLLNCIGNHKYTVLDYFRLAKDYSIERDILFYNLLIRHVCNNLNDTKRLTNALHFVEELQKDGLKPDIGTFESLALGCDTLKSALQLIFDVEKCGFTLSGIIIKRIFKCALYKSDFRYLNAIIKLCRTRNIMPVKHLVESLEEKRLYAHDVILKYENGQLREDEIPSWLNDEQIKNFDEYCKAMSRWLSTVELIKEEHPWNQFKVENQSHKVGFYKFIHKFKALEKVKQEALEKGHSYVNLNDEAEKVFQKETRWNS